MKLVYLAGPYSNPDPVENVHNAVMLADEVLQMGAVPVIPHLTATWHMISPKPYEEWLRIDLEQMRRCDVVFRFPGASSGADKEVVAAEAEGIPVVYSRSELAAWLWRNAE